MNKRLLHFALIFATVSLTACITPQVIDSSPPLKSWNRFAEDTLIHTNSAQEFETAGPYEVKLYEDYAISLSPKERLLSDLYFPVGANKTPLVIMVHGNKFNKAVHAAQARRLASWGFHTLVLQVPNQGRWIKNGKAIEKLVRIINKFPGIVSSKVDAKRIILIGHSFGGSAVTIAAARKAPVAGLILLDPAVVHKNLKRYMQKVTVPVILLGADKKVFSARKRREFFKNIRGPITEVSITGATHNDAQSPSINTVTWGFDLKTTTKHQETFMKAIVASAFSIGYSKNNKFAWKSFLPLLKSGVLKNNKRRARRVIRNKMR